MVHVLANVLTEKFGAGILCQIFVVVEAAGVELFSVLTAYNLLILRMARGATKAPLPTPLYVYCTKISSSSCRADC